MNNKLLKISVSGSSAPTEGVFLQPKNSIAILVLAHGAGAGMHHPWMQTLSESLFQHRVATLRFQFLYMAQGKKRVDSPATSVETIVAAIQAAKDLCPALPLYSGGKSFGARMTTTAAAQGRLDGVRGIVCYGFPLHPAKKPATMRAEHLADVRIPTLFLQGTRDALADLTLLKPIVESHAKWIRLQEIEAADHGFSVPKSSGRKDADVFTELAVATAAFCEKVRS